MKKEFFQILDKFIDYTVQVITYISQQLNINQFYAGLVILLLVDLLLEVLRKKTKTNPLIIVTINVVFKLLLINLYSSVKLTGTTEFLAQWNIVVLRLTGFAVALWRGAAIQKKDIVNFCADNQVLVAIYVSQLYFFTWQMVVIYLVSNLASFIYEAAIPQS